MQSCFYKTSPLLNYVHLAEKHLEPMLPRTTVKLYESLDCDLMMLPLTGNIEKVLPWLYSQ